MKGDGIFLKICTVILSLCDFYESFMGFSW